jgi:chemotaxis protein methyltransferase CheR
MLTSEQFDRVRRLALQFAGIELSERHRPLLDRRCQRVGLGDAAGFDALLMGAERGDTAAAQQLVGLITTRYTGFFRHLAHFEVAARHARWAAQQRGTARLWSAAAASGEEPYSLAMALVDAFGRDNPPVTILATDIHEEALTAARRGQYSDVAMEGLAPEQRARFFTQVATRRWRLAPAIRALVTFRCLNLAEPHWTLSESFDVIFCRNVLLYLEAHRREEVLQRIVARLAPDGVLIIDPVEHLGQAGREFSAVGQGVYRRPHRPTTAINSIATAALRGRGG